MAKDNRKVNYAVRVGGVVLTDEDEISANLSQAELDNFVKKGYLEGDWSSTKAEENAEVETTDKTVAVKSKSTKAEKTE